MAPPLAAMSRHRQCAITQFVVVTTLVRAVGRGALISLTTLYVPAVAHLSVPDVGHLLAALGLAGSVGAYASGRAADRTGTRALLSGLMALETIGFVGFVFFDRPPALVGAGILVAFANVGGAAVRSTLIARNVEPPSRTALRSSMYSASTVGTGAGAALGSSVAAARSPTAYGAALVALCLAYGVAAAYTLTTAAPLEAPRPHRDDGRTPERLPRSRPDPAYLTLVLCAGILALASTVPQVGLPLWVTRRTAVPPGAVGIFMVANACLAVALRRTMARIGERFVRSPHVVAGLCTGVLVAVLVSAAIQNLSGAAGVAAALTAVVAWTVVDMASQTSVWAVAFRITPERSAGRYQGVLTTAGSAGAVLGPIVFTRLPMRYGAVGWLLLAVPLLAAIAAVSRTGQPLQGLPAPADTPLRVGVSGGHSSCVDRVPT